MIVTIMGISQPYPAYAEVTSTRQITAVLMQQNVTIRAEKFKKRARFKSLLHKARQSVSPA